MTKRTLDVVSSEDCYALLAEVTLGRLVYVDEDGPAAVPVNYALVGHDIAFRSDPGSKIGALGDRPVAFEVDQVDAVSRSGWSVLVRGRAEIVALDQVPALLARVEGAPPLPWKKGIHGIWVVITPTAVTGRRLLDLAFDDFF
jgi:nitroimidazol reductase NimA-like FMN-containing flavoprotein (pyridoxamine 5'-phosphate oxidase superfamily)